MRRPTGALTLVLLLAAGPAAATDLVDHIDPFIGTGGHGHTFPGPTLPFGMVQLSPDTRLTGWDGCSGYHNSDSVVFGFSHTHLSGTGARDYGDILLMPLTGEPLLDNGYPDRPDQGYGSRFSKGSEQAAAGWYAVRLEDYGIDVELTATPRTGLHRYVFPAGRPAHVIVDLEHRDQVLDADLGVEGDRTLDGFRRSRHWAQDQLIHFRAVFSRPFVATSFVRDAEGRAVKAVLSFGDQGGELLVQVGISAVDAQGARTNLDAEWADFDFAATRARARAAWAAVLEPFKVEGAADRDLAILATALYHGFIAPNLFSDADGRYRGMDLQTHTVTGRDQYTVFSLWDTYRATHPLFTLVQRVRTGEFVATMLAQYQDGGRLPVWELAANETECMIGYHSVSVIADAWLKGIGGFSGDLALEAMLDSALRDHFGLESYQRDGFISSDLAAESVSRTLEYAYDDFCIAEMARSLDRPDPARVFARRSQAWRHLYDAETGFFRPRRNGQWLVPFDPALVDHNYTEASAWQYRFAVPQDPAALIARMGGDEAFVAALADMFAADSTTTGRDLPDITGRMGQYVHGNEPSHHVAWLHHAAGRPQLTADRVVQVLDAFYTDGPEGLIGNEDCGQMSAWYVLAAYGLYDLAPGAGQWLIIPPRFSAMTMEFEDGRRFTTRREGEGAVQSVTFNGAPLSRSWLSHAEVIGGGELVFHLGSAGRWGQDPADRPIAGPRYAPIVPAPWAVAANDRFRGRLEVALAGAESGAQLRWTDDPAADPVAGRPYDNPVVLARTTTLRFVAVRPDGESSPVVTAEFIALPEHWTVSLGAAPDPDYAAGGPDALIDGRRGPDDWRHGGWLGTEKEDVVITLDLGAPTAVHRVSLGVLQDTGSWVLLPRHLEVEVSTDGTAFTPAGRVDHDVPAEAGGVIRRDLVLDLDGVPLRALRLTAPNAGPLPAGHPGAGGAAYVFVDEIIVE